jgi:catechol 2,3-dioxygenase-like lactoylglutathione lyase family enzyme
MAIVLDHTVLPARDNEASAGFFAEVMGLQYEGPDRHFAPVRVNGSLTLDFVRVEEAFAGHHLAFRVDDEEFEGILRRLQAKGVPYGDDPRTPDNGRTSHPLASQGLYFVDPNGHLFEVMTMGADPVRGPTPRG